MPWWGWLLLAWAVAATVAGLLLGVVAAKQRVRERAWRRHQYESHLPEPEERRAAS